MPRKKENYHLKYALGFGLLIPFGIILLILSSKFYKGIFNPMYYALGFNVILFLIASYNSFSHFQLYKK